MTHTPRVAAVVTAYHPDASLPRAVRSVVDQVERVVVVDDGSPAAVPELDECAALGAIVVRHGTNRGIGAALNTGIRAARSSEPLLTHVLTLDQDSELPADLVAALLAAEHDARAVGVPVGMSSPGSVATVTRGSTTRADTYAEGGEPIQSGLLLPVATLDLVGEFDESLVIDGVDTDYWLRSLDHGLVAIVAPGAVLEHRLGQPIVLPSGRRLPLVVASDFRYFYQWRNLVRLLSRHARRHRSWAVGAVARATRHLVIVTVLAPGRAARLRLAAAGLRAGLRGEAGVMPEQRAGDRRGL